MRIAVVGSGYVGLVTGACFADIGIEVVCVDIDKAKIEALRGGNVPIYEPGLEEVIRRNMKARRLHFATSLGEYLAQVDVVFCAVGTPPDDDGGADLGAVLDVARQFGEQIEKYTLFVTKSTVPVGTSGRVRQTIERELERRGVTIDFDVASNPEFLKEGNAIDDFMSPDRVIVGVDGERARRIMSLLYKPFMLNSDRLIFTDITSAEMIKYAANAMLATRISFMNEIANLCERVGADINMIRCGIGSDPRIGNKFLYAGCGYGGSCFPKDVKALAHTAREYESPLGILEAVERANEHQKRVLFDKLLNYYGGDLKERNVAIWGLSFKPETDDMREAPSLTIIELLLSAGANVRAYDPIARGEAKRRLGDTITLCATKEECLVDADALLLVTEWREFRLPDWDFVRRTMRTPLVLDGRNIYPDMEGIIKIGIGVKQFNP